LDDYYLATVKTMTEDCKLVDAGSVYVFDIDDLKIFLKKRV
jgi:hypothetical protein